jgi:outer membrane protein assembly factor BamB
MQWSLELPPGHSSPCVSGERIFLTAFDETARKLFALCVDRANGRLLWKRERSVEKFEHTHEISNPATATPATDGKAAFFYFASYGLTAYDFDGKELWTKPLPMAVNRMGFGSGTSPIVAGDLVLLDVHAGQESHLLALRCRDGETAWKAANPLFNEGWSTPVVWREGNDELVGVLNAQRFSARRMKDGSEKWWLPGLPNQTCATPAVGDGFLFITGTGVLGEREELIRPPVFDEMIAKYDTNKDGKISTDEIPESLLIADRKSAGGAGNMSIRRFLLFSTGGKAVTLDRADWEKALSEFDEFAKGDFMTTRVMAVRTGGTGDVSSSAVVWSEAKGIPEVPSPLLVGNRLYLVKAGGVVICRDAASGKSLFEDRLGAAGGYYASPVMAAGRIYAASDRGTVVVFEATDSLKVLARNDLKEPIMATPAIVDGKLYVRTASRLYAFK